jgi:hypothetical protein
LTEFELYEAFHGAEASWQGAAGIFISNVFAYIVVAYLVGSKLTRSQVAIVTCLYSIFSIGMLFALSDILGRMSYLSAGIAQFDPAGPFAEAIGSRAEVRETVAPILFTGALFCTYSAGLLFMFQVRRNARVVGK